MGKTQEVVSGVLKALALVMGIVVIVLSMMNKNIFGTGFLLLGIGMFCISISSLQGKKY